jgi:hypothetical protein
VRGDRLIKFAAAALFAVLVPVSLAAQEGLRDRDPQLDAAKRITDDLRRATLRHGPLYLLSELHFSDIGVEQRFYVPTNNQSQGINFSISAPQRLYLVATKKVIFSVDAAPTWAFGLKTNDDPNTPLVNEKRKQNQFGWRTRADSQLLFNHLFLDTYVAATNDLYANTGEINRIVTQKNREGGILGEWKYSSRTSGTFSAIYRQIDYPQNRFQPADRPVDLLDRREHNYRASLFHKTFPLTGLFLAGEAGDYRFKRATYKDSNRIYGGAGFLYDDGRNYWRLEAGDTKLRFDAPRAKNFQGITANTQFNRRVAAHWSGSFDAARDIEFSIFANNDFFVLDRAGTSLEWATTRRLSLRAGFQVGRDSYQVPVNGVLRRDDYTYPWVGFLYTIRRFRGGFDVGYYDRSTNLPGLVEEENGIRVVLRLSFTP